MPRRRLAAVPDRPGRVVAYVRVSALAGRGGEDFHSPDVQLAAIRRTTAGLQEIAVVEDIDRTGRHFAREGIEQIRAMAQAQQIDALAVYDVSRLGRNVRESLTFLNWLADHGVTILSACEQVDTSTPAGRLMLTNMLAIAEYRSDEIGRGWSATIARRAERGQHHGKPLGYIHKDKRMVPDPVLGPAMAEVFRRYATGERIADVAAYLAAVRGKPIHTANLKKAMRNPVYRGYVVAAGELLPGDHEPLVDEETWQKVQDRIAAEATTPARHLAPTWSLVGLCECPAGHKLQRQPIKRRDRYEDRLVCGMGRGGVAGKCPGVGRPLLDRVEAETLRQVASYASRLRTDHAARAARLAHLTTARADRASLERELARTRAAMVRLTKMRALDGDISEQVYRETMAELRQAETAAAAELAKLGTGELPPDPEQAAGAVEALLSMWPQMTYAEKGKALRSVVRRIVVRPAAFWREPEDKRVDVQFRW
jgi:DNA invertase Pin-like site-specific DNA recombinase